MKEKRMRKEMRRRMRGLIETEFSSVKILTGSDLSQRKLPFMYARSVNQGPTVWFTAGIHGDEVGGMVVVQEIFKKLKNSLLRGSVYAFPLMNPLGFESASRHITLSEEDLNRSFIGNPTGSLAERMADKIFTKILSTKPALVLDLHNDWRESIPYALIDPLPNQDNKEVYERVIYYSKKSGFPVIVDTKDYERTLTYNLIKHNIPAITLELGESYVVNEKNVEAGIAAVYNILKQLGMIEIEDIKSSYVFPDEIKGRLLKLLEKPFSSSSGIIRFLVKPGEIVRREQTIAKIYNPFGKLLEIVKALDDAIVLGYSDSSVAFPGAPIMASGVL